MGYNIFMKVSWVYSARHLSYFVTSFLLAIFFSFFNLFINLFYDFTYTNIDTELLVGLIYTGQTTHKYLAVRGQSLYSYFIVTTTSGIIIYFDIV